MKKSTNFYTCILLVLFTCLLSAGYSQVAFTPGNLVVYRAGNGAAALSSATTAVFLDEYTPAGVLVQSVAVPTSGANRLTIAGSSGAEGLIALSPDGKYLILPGYDTIPGVAAIAGTTSANINRKLLRIDNALNYLAVLSSTAFSGGNIRGGVTTGTDYWASGSNQGINYLGTGASALVSNTVTNTRSIGVQNGQLYFSTGSGTTGVYAVGTGLPITTGQTSVVVITTGTSSTASPYAFSFNSTSDICYVADDRTTAPIGGVQKWTKSGSVWSLSYTLAVGTSTGAGARGLIVDWSGTNPVIYATTSATLPKIVKIIDAGASSVYTELATSATNTAFRGITFTPVSIGVTAPTVQTSNITFSTVTNTGMTVNYTPGNGAKRIVTLNTSNSFTNPADGTDPVANSVYGGSGEQVIYNNSGSAVSVTGLSPGTTYWFRAYEYNGSGVSTKYLTTTASLNPNSQSTTSIPDAITNAATFINSTGATMNGTVNANNASTTVTFEYGLTNLYGQSMNATPNIVTGNTATAVSATVSGLVIDNIYHYRVKAVNGSGTSYGNDLTFLTGCQIPVAAGAIIGNAVVCQSASGVAYSVGAILNATSYVWTLPVGATITSGAGTNSIVVSYSPTAVSGTITVKGTNDCGIGVLSTLAVTVNPLPVPTLVTGPLASCVGSTGVVYSTQAGMTGYTWTISAGGTITAGAGTNSITVSWNVAGAQTLRLNYTSVAGCTATAPVVFNVTVATRPVPVVTGPANACLGFANNVYSTQAGNSGYTWTISAGGAITAGAGTNAITVTWSTTGAKVVTVDYTIPAGCNAVTPTSFNVNVNQTPSPTIAGSSSVCAGTNGVTYTTEAGFSNYVWTISYDGIITSGLNTNSVTVNWPTAGTRYIAVNYSNSSGCSAVSSTYRAVSVLTVPVPLIFGETAVCQGAAGVTYTTQAGNTNYVWTVSSGGTITAGAGTAAIKVTWNAGGNQTVSVNYTNALGCVGVQPAVYNITVAPLPAVGGTITGPASVCSGAQGIAYTVPAVANATTYNWSVPAGVTIESGATTNSITVNFSAAAASGVIKVNGVNTCGNGAISPDFNVTVNALPATPVITQVPVGDTLISSAASGNQWYRNGVAITGATGKKLKPVYLGTYTVIVTLNGCSSLLSNAIVVTKIVAVADLEVSNTFDVYPNPSRGQFNIKVVSGKPVVLNIEVYNNLGAMQWKQENVHIDGTYFAPVNLGSVPAGVYMIALRNGDLNIVRKMIIMK